MVNCSEAVTSCRGKEVGRPCCGVDVDGIGRSMAGANTRNVVDDLGVA